MRKIIGVISVMLAAAFLGGCAGGGISGNSMLPTANQSVFRHLDSVGGGIAAHRIQHLDSVGGGIAARRVHHLDSVGGGIAARRAHHLDSVGGGIAR
jgi:hypothetical protein